MDIYSLLLLSLYGDILLRTIIRFWALIIRRSKPGINMQIIVILLQIFILGLNPKEVKQQFMYILSIPITILHFIHIRNKPNSSTSISLPHLVIFPNRIDNMTSIMALPLQ